MKDGEKNRERRKGQNRILKEEPRMSKRVVARIVLLAIVAAVFVVIPAMAHGKWYDYKAYPTPSPATYPDLEACNDNADWTSFWGVVKSLQSKTIVGTFSSDGANCAAVEWKKLPTTGTHYMIFSVQWADGHRQSSIDTDSVTLINNKERWYDYKAHPTPSPATYPDLEACNDNADWTSFWGVVKSVQSKVVVGTFSSDGDSCVPVEWTRQPKTGSHYMIFSVQWESGKKQIAVDTDGVTIIVP
ncbi:hypothetical protein HY546_03370 [archaeon]|nr:hypothetical protein [archaeon]